MAGKQSLSQRDHEIVAIALTCLENTVGASFTALHVSKTSDIVTPNAFLPSIFTIQITERKANPCRSTPGH